MLTESIIVSFLMILGINAVIWYRWYWGVPVFIVAGFVSFCFLSIAVPIQSFWTMASLLLLFIPKYGRVVFAVASILAAGYAYYIVFESAKRQDHGYDDLREKFPLVSMTGRITEPKKTTFSSKDELRQLTLLEEQLASKSREEFKFRSDFASDYAFQYATHLHEVHQNHVIDFAGRPGFGFARMEGVGSFSDHQFRSMIERPPGVEPVPHPEKPMSFTDPGEVLSSGAIDESLARLHLKGIIDFSNPQGFGYVKSRSQVAGFRPHRFSQVPDGNGWDVKSVELVGVLVHATPAVYVSEFLPKMDQLSATKTRPLDAFEQEGLEAIKKGEDLFVRGKDSSARMIGAIRSAKQCVDCHGGERGALLGAFSYRLVKR